MAPILYSGSDVAAVAGATGAVDPCPLPDLGSVFWLCAGSGTWLAPYASVCEHKKTAANIVGTLIFISSLPLILPPPWTSRLSWFPFCKNSEAHLQTCRSSIKQPLSFPAITGVRGSCCRHHAVLENAQKNQGCVSSGSSTNVLNPIIYLHTNDNQ